MVHVTKSNINNDIRDSQKKEPLTEKTSNFSDSNYSIFCPARLAMDKELSDGARCTYLIISNFLNRDGFAFASNKWLIEGRPQDERQIIRHLEELEARGYIWRQVYNEGFKKRRLIWIHEKYAEYVMVNEIDDPNFTTHLKKLQKKKIIANPSESKGIGNNSKNVCDMSYLTTPNPSNTTTPNPSNLTDRIYKYNNKEESTSVPLPSIKNKEPDHPPPDPDIPQTNLPLFHPNRKYLKGLSEEEIRQVQICYEKSKNTIQNPVGWITECVKQGWYKENLISDSDLQANFSLARRVELNFEKLALSNPYTYFEATPTGMNFFKGGNEIPMPTYKMAAQKFKEIISNILKKYYDLNKIFA